MVSGILKRFREKNLQFFFQDFNSGANIQRLFQLWVVKAHVSIIVSAQSKELGFLDFV